jgi:predicted AAA+ superfamily ATPase
MLKRALADTVCSVSKSFPVLLLTGPRQVGKTTLLQELSEPSRNYVTLDDLDQRMLAQNDPALFLQTYKPPIIIDEVQYAPNLFSYIKIHTDTHNENGVFWLIGSQKFHLMQGIQESLAGRIAIIDMLGLSSKEIQNRLNLAAPFLPTPEWISVNKCSAEKSLMDIYSCIWNGGFPRLVTENGKNRDIFYKSYIQTYIARDVKDSYNISDSIGFYNFLRTVAARTGQLLNYANIARDVGIAPRTAKIWLSVLERSGLVCLLYPYYKNITKRIVKTPKVYFLDTGLCAYLTSWDSPRTLEAGAMSGAILETYVFSEILKSYWNNGQELNIYFYRDDDQREIDFLVERNGKIYPIEVKKTATPCLATAKSFNVLNSLKIDVEAGCILCLRPNTIPLSKNIMSIPMWWV